MALLSLDYTAARAAVSMTDGRLNAASLAELLEVSLPTGSQRPREVEVRQALLSLDMDRDGFVTHADLSLWFGPSYHDATLPAGWVPMSSGEVGK